MAKNVSSYEADAKAMVERIEAARAAGEQLTFLPDEPAPADSDRAKPAKGLRLPEDVLVQMAGLASTDDAFLTAMARTEQILAWAEAGGRDVGYVMTKDGSLVEKELDNRHTTAQRLAAFQFVYTAQLRAAEALLPYGLAKVTPDVAVTMPVQIVMPAAQAGSDPAATARDITPQPRRMAPPPMPHEIKQNQGLGNPASGHSDGIIRTDEASR
jgi:hypothetical protein